jgi:hypothetical protein
MYGLASGSSSPEAIPLLDEIRVVHSGDSGKTWDTPGAIKEASVHYLRPEIVLEPQGAIDVIAYTGAQEGDRTGSIRSWRSTNSGVSFAPLATLRSPTTLTGTRSSSLWIGDYSGLVFDNGELLATIADNSSGASHIAFVRAAVP